MPTSIFDSPPRGRCWKTRRAPNASTPYGIARQGWVGRWNGSTSWTVIWASRAPNRAAETDFQKLVSEVALGKAGLVMGLEVSRLARNSADWHRLIELCSLVGVLILDEDGIYDPANFNDRLLLGLNRPETQSTPCSTSRRFLWTVFWLGSRMLLARR